MMKTTSPFDKALVLAVLFMVAMAIWRVFAAWFGNNAGLANFSPIGAMALFGGVMFGLYEYTRQSIPGLRESLSQIKNG